MTEIKPDYINAHTSPGVSAPAIGDYWKKIAYKEQARADDNLRLAAERANEIAELKQELELNKANLYAMGKYVIEIAELREKLKEASTEMNRLRDALAGCMLLADNCTENALTRLALISQRCRDELRLKGGE